MYKLEYLPIARRDIIDIARYIKKVLGNPSAASKLAKELVEAAESLRQFPYACPIYYPLQPCGRDFRKLSVKNYILFYWVDEEQNTVTVARVVYAKRSYDDLLRDPTLLN